MVLIIIPSKYVKGDTKLKPIICFVGASNSGKTTLISKVISRLVELGFKVGSIKHAPHGFQFFKGKDSSVHKLAGARVSIVSSPGMIGILKDTDRDMTPQELIYYMEDVDLVIVEGFKGLPLPKIEVFSPKEGTQQPLCLGDPNLLAIVTSKGFQTDLPVFDPKDIDSIAQFVLKVAGLGGKGAKELFK